jgi:hypothetical protein
MAQWTSPEACGWMIAMAATCVACDRVPQARIAAAVAIDDVPEVAPGVAQPQPLSKLRGDLGGGCWAEAPRVVDRREWPRPGARLAPDASDARGRSLYAVDAHHRIGLWRGDGSSEQGYDLVAMALGDDGAAVGVPVVLSSGVVGAPVTRATDPPGVTVWFLEDSETEDGPLRLASTVHCAP